MIRWTSLALWEFEFSLPVSLASAFLVCFPAEATVRELFFDSLLVCFIILTIRWTGLAPWELEIRVPGSLTPTFP
jgi:hypothetical protein